MDFATQTYTQINGAPTTGARKEESPLDKLLNGIGDFVRQNIEWLESPEEGIN